MIVICFVILHGSEEEMYSHLANEICQTKKHSDPIHRRFAKDFLDWAIQR